jgi:signal transduction histidine kinase
MPFASSSPEAAPPWSALGDALLATVLDDVDVGLLLAAPDGRVRGANAAARVLLDPGPGLEAAMDRLRAGLPEAGGHAALHGRLLEVCIRPRPGAEGDALWRLAPMGRPRPTLDDAPRAAARLRRGAALAHRLNNLLAAVVAEAEDLQADATASSATAAADALMQAARDGADLVDDLMAFARSPEGGAMPHDLHALSTAWARRRLGWGGPVRVQGVATWAHVDADRLEALLDDVAAEARAAGARALALRVGAPSGDPTRGPALAIGGAGEALDSARLTSVFGDEASRTSWKTELSACGGSAVLAEVSPRRFRLVLAFDAPHGEDRR